MRISDWSSDVCSSDLFCASSRHGISGPRTPAGGRAMRQFIERHSFWSFVILIALGVFLWLVFAVWPEWLEDAIGRKKTFVNTFLTGLTLAGLYFLVASEIGRASCRERVCQYG